MILSTPAQLLFSFRFLGHNSRITLWGGRGWRKSFLPDLLNIWHLCSPLWISMTKGGRQGFLTQAWWTSKPQIWFTKIYRVITQTNYFYWDPPDAFAMLGSHQGEAGQPCTLSPQLGTAAWPWRTPGRAQTPVGLTEASCLRLHRGLSTGTHGLNQDWIWQNALKPKPA